LSKDPWERNNLFGTLDGGDELMLKALRRFFQVHGKSPRRKKREVTALR
jgi:hypothetical protein